MHAEFISILCPFKSIMLLVSVAFEKSFINENDVWTVAAGIINASIFVKTNSNSNKYLASIKNPSLLAFFM